MRPLKVKIWRKSKLVFDSKKLAWSIKASVWYFNIKSGNGEIIARSEGYTRKVGAEKAVKRLIAGMANAIVHIEMNIEKE